MSPRAQNTPKAVLNAKALEKNDIQFETYIHNADELPPWLRPVRKFLTSQRTKLSFDMKSDFDDPLDEFCSERQDGWDLKPKDEYFEREKLQKKTYSEPDTTNPQLVSEIRDCGSAKRKFKELYDNNEYETEWQTWLKVWVFTSYTDIENGHGALNNILMRWEIFQSLSWSEFEPTSDFIMNDQVILTCPTPDFTYGFPIIDTMNPVYKPYMNHRSIKNFSISSLSKLRREKGIVSSPRTALKRWKDSKSMAEKPKSADLTCFPWAIVEVKSAHVKPSEVTFCYCQAANASAAALALREKLQTASKKNDPNPDALVIFSFTCIGPDVKLWVTYRTSGKVVMQCIWATSLKLLWGIFALRMVIQNMHDWVNQEVRPELVRWIEGAREYKPKEVFLSPSCSRARSSTPTASNEAQTGSLRATALGSPKRLNASSPTSSARANAILDKLSAQDDDDEEEDEEEGSCEDSNNDSTEESSGEDSNSDSNEESSGEESSQDSSEESSSEDSEEYSSEDEGYSSTFDFRPRADKRLIKSGWHKQKTYTKVPRNQLLAARGKESILADSLAALSLSTDKKKRIW